MIIQHNMSAINNINIGKQLGMTMAENMERLSSGYKINRAADDAANLAISEKMNARIRALKRCQNNIEEGIGLAQTADGALQEVNNMLVRVHELCVQAANGTNTEDDRMMIADEIEQLYEEMDRVFEDTEYNTIPVFHYDGINFNSGKEGYAYTETVTRLPDGQFSEWGKLNDIQEKPFDLAKDAVGGKVTLTLDKDVNLDDAATLNGKSFYLEFKTGVNSKRTVKFEFNTTESGIKYDNDYGIYINYVKIASGQTVQQAFDELCSNNQYSSVFSDSEFNKATVEEKDGKKQVTFYFDPKDLNQNFFVDGSDSNYLVADGNGKITNEYTIQNREDASLDKLDSGANKVVHKNSIKAEFNLPDWAGNRTLTTERKKAILESELDIYIDGTTKTITFTEAEVNGFSSIDDVNDGLKAKFEAFGYDVAIDNNKFIISTENSDLVDTSKSDSIGYVKERKKADTEKKTNTVSVSVAQLTAPTMEKAGKWVVTLPSDLDETDFPFSLNIAGSNYTIYDRNKCYVDADGSNESIVYNGDIMSAVESAFQSKYYNNAVVTKSGNKIIIEAKNVNQNLNVSVSSNELNYHTYGFVGNYNEYFIQEYDISFDLSEASGGVFNPESLYGKGFEHNGRIYEFTNATNKLVNDQAIRFDISSCMDYDQIADVMEQKMNDHNGYSYYYDYSVKNSNGIITITAGRRMESGSSNFYKPSYSDGYSGMDGLFLNGAGTGSYSVSGGTDTTQPQTTVDFSKYTAENKDELYGKGFRITCATCPGEFINIMFCDDKSTCEYPESFQFTDADGNTNEIKNYIVELKDVSHGSQIVDSIVNQLKGELDHYTDVEADGAVLVVKDKRVGNIVDGNGVIQRAEIISGVYTNFTYHMNKERVIDSSEIVGDGRKDTDAYYSYVMIYSSDTADKPFIPLHLPTLTLENLKLEPITDNFAKYEGVTEVMKRSKTAAEVITIARSKIGADQNRLEHAFESAANAEIQITDAYSRIRDADMAEEMVIQAKVSILLNAQQAMLSQIVNQPEKILPLLQG